MFIPLLGYARRAGNIDSIGDGNPIPLARLSAASSAAPGTMSIAHYDLLDDATNAFSGNTLVKRDAGGGFEAGAIQVVSVVAAGDITASVYHGDGSSLAGVAPIDSPSFTGDMQVGGEIRLTADSAFVSGVSRFYRSATHGSVIQGFPGSAWELAIVSSAGALLMANPIGTFDFAFGPTGAVNLGIGTANEFGSGTSVIGLHNATVAPTANPTAGGVLYAEGGALKWRGSGGTVSVVAPA